MDRPTALDLAFLDLETPQAPLHVGWTLRFDGAPPSLAGLRRHLDARLHAVPRFRRRLARPLLGAPCWVDDPGFDVAHHAFRVTLAAPGGEAELLDVAGALLSQPLPAGRPLWRIYLVDGLRSGGFALVGQAHHALVDGIAAVEVALLLFGDPEARGDDGCAPGWAPQRAPSEGEAARTTLGARVRAATATALDLSRAALGTGAAGALRDAARTVESFARPVSPTSLDRSATAERAVAFASVPFHTVREAGRRAGATVNDVLLAASTLALRAELRRRGDRPDTLRALVPISVRADDPGALGNQISFLPVELPVGEPDPARVLRVVRARTAAAKEGGDAGALEAVARAAEALSGSGRRLLTRAAVRAVGFNLVISNVPGPPIELSLLGRPLVAIHPMVPLLHGHALSIGAVSYAGRLQLGLAADAAVLPDVAATARALEAAFDTLYRGEAPPRDGTGGTGGSGQTPWAARARARRQRAANR
ncbi:MAG TPA: wax ester/triacylglycerol synthase family O-acyltransferase [Baekduia sp.]|uniref:wax ester/triacylglycerol synthase family O-acyltransferase n=1 Tax=Baekduia sp. TaxID=2600305 RepID=UPI002D1B800D|nr:wax ester/triacylglycerol synthase family O-acyltransferase [Baekduia sp.]HMJ32371.1 wax ester/triacylglycerol synthase family O-acyltransferase [Baekduia sp.]